MEQLPERLYKNTFVIATIDYEQNDDKCFAKPD
jgi:hypothetical protein